MYSQQEINILTSESGSSSSFVVVNDNSFNDIIDKICSEVKALTDHLKPAKMSTGDENWADKYFRGDMLCWITPTLCDELNLVGLNQLVQRMTQAMEPLKSSLGLNGEVTVQFALYPGKGEGYNRHKDAFAATSGHSCPKGRSRQLTSLLYLNKYWEPDDGGQLRIFSPVNVEISGDAEPFDFWGVNGFDINPTFGRWVTFRSEIVEHAVLPCFYERMALTFWFTGTGPSSSASSTSRLGLDQGKDAALLFVPSSRADTSINSDEQSLAQPSCQSDTEDDDCEDSTR